MPFLVRCRVDLTNYKAFAQNNKHRSPHADDSTQFARFSRYLASGLVCCDCATINWTSRPKALDLSICSFNWYVMFNKRHANRHNSVQGSDMTPHSIRLWWAVIWSVDLFDWRTSKKLVELWIHYHYVTDCFELSHEICVNLCIMSFWLRRCCCVFFLNPISSASSLIKSPSLIDDRLFKGSSRSDYGQHRMHHEQLVKSDAVLSTESLRAKLGRA